MASCEDRRKKQVLGDTWTHKIKLDLKHHFHFFWLESQERGFHPTEKRFWRWKCKAGDFRLKLSLPHRNMHECYGFWRRLRERGICEKGLLRLCGKFFSLWPAWKEIYNCICGLRRHSKDLWLNVNVNYESSKTCFLQLLQVWFANAFDWEKRHFVIYPVA